MKNTIKNITTGVFAAVLVAALALSASCTKLYDVFNSDKYSANDEQMQGDFLLYGALVMQMQRDLIPTSEEDANEFQRAQNLAGDIFGGYMSAIGTWNGGSNNSTYNLYYANWCDVAFAVAYANTMAPWFVLKELAEANDDDAPLAMGYILKVGGMHRITDMYGPIPYSDFGNDEFTTGYDSQEEVYVKFFEELDWAIGVLKDFPEPTLLGNYDIFFGGDVSKWLKYANSLKLRLALRISGVSGYEALAEKYAEEAVAAGVMEDNSHNAAIKSHGSLKVYNPLYVCWNQYADTRMSATMDSYMNGYSDPRLAKYFQVAAASGTAYWGVRNGLEITNKTNYLGMSAPNVTASDAVKVMSAAECWFLRAEGALNGWDMGGTAQALYETGITVSFDECGVAGAATYIADNTLTPTAFVANGGTSGGTPALGTVKIAWDASATKEANLERIITQKWIAGFPEGQEAWSEFRRTGYPKIFPVASNLSGGTINTATQVCRLIFPRSEYQQNAEGVAIGVGLLGGPDNGGVKLWWDTK